MNQSRVTALEPEDHPHWSEPAHDLRHRFAVGWIVRTWLIALVAAVVLSTLAILALSLVADPFGQGRSGIATIGAGLATFVAFILVLRARVLALPEDRLLNTMSVAVLHVSVAGIAMLVGALVGSDQLGSSPDSFRENLGVIMTAVERSSAAVILAALLIPGIVPATGDTPDGTQVAETPQDRQL